MSNALKLLAAIAICESAGIAGAFFTRTSVTTWYQELVKPSFTPPPGMIGIVWTVLYLLMGISLYLVWRQGLEKPAIKTAVLIFGIQLILNITWSILFFGLKSPFLALIEIVILWAAIVLTIVYFRRISKTAAILLLPYLLWVTFAAFLNLAFYQLNS